MDKGISEGNFIKVIYQFLLGPDSRKHSMEDMEEMARTALYLHKIYWEKCRKDCIKKLNTEMFEDYKDSTVKR